MDDERVVEQVVGGNRQAFRLLVLRYERPLFRFLALLGFDAASREDLAQQTFLSAFRALTAFDATKGRFSTWLFTIAKNHAAHERQRAHRRHEISSTETVEGSLRGAESDPVESLVLAQRTRALEEALRSLPAVLQSTFILSRVRWRLPATTGRPGCRRRPRRPGSQARRGDAGPSPARTELPASPGAS